MNKPSGDFFAPMQRTSEAELAVKFPTVIEVKAAEGSLRRALGAMVLAGFSKFEIMAKVDTMLDEIQNQEAA